MFQAEDGIRDLVRSRGLGDVYKRQAEYTAEALITVTDSLMPEKPKSSDQRGLPDYTFPVSYTHLTLPTSDLV